MIRVFAPISSGLPLSGLRGAGFYNERLTKTLGAPV